MTAENQSFSAVQKLDASHDVDGFDCGKEPLDRFLQRHALVNQKAGSAQTYVVCRGEQRVAGYYSLAVGAVEHAEAPGRVSKGLARHPIPVMLLARLAIDRAEQGKGLGKALLKDALLRTAQAADIAGIRALLVHAKDDEARAWYEQFDFEPSPTDPYHLFLLMKDLRALLGE
ncbi:GNAT family N-acetyltransferase [Marinicauda algicola]|uniref:GNAT family N-acetyltransferase n=1 Tax=Marinicauda algicola TaxID=2029849 RepID=A0A4S2GXM6_9PROT|nr:GNAT family N-acetyltransferase [Marinicauda algicola]TGY87814.1 GNAT family N-acetyltransferase [Marinicauda algicola]